MPRITTTHKPSKQQIQDAQELQVKAALRRLNALDARIDRLVKALNHALNIDIEAGA